eukprot:6207033-Pleurochrysis_carterae.AAC.1
MQKQSLRICSTSRLAVRPQLFLDSGAIAAAGAATDMLATSQARHISGAAIIIGDGGPTSYIHTTVSESTAV